MWVVLSEFKPTQHKREFSEIMTTKHKREFSLKSRQQSTNVSSVWKHNKAQTWFVSEITSTKHKRQFSLKPHQQSTNVTSVRNHVNKAEKWVISETTSTKQKRDLLLKSDRQNRNVSSLWNHANKEEKCVSIQNTRCWLHIKRASLTLVVIQTEQNLPHIQRKEDCAPKDWVKITAVDERVMLIHHLSVRMLANVEFSIADVKINQRLPYKVNKQARLNCQLWRNNAK